MQQRPTYQRSTNRRRKRARQRSIVVFGAVVIVTAVVVSLALMIKYINALSMPASGKPSSSAASSPDSQPGTGSEAVNGTASNNGAATTADTAAFSTADYSNISETAADLYAGDLILVNNSNKYEGSIEDKLTNVYDNQNHTYKVSDRNVTILQKVMEPLNTMLSDFKNAQGATDLMIACGYRSVKTQQTIFDNSVKQKGLTETKKFVANPGYSEHQTGLALDFTLFTDAGKSLDYNGTGKYKWINDNCYKYGFIVRYPSSKSSITGISTEPWHFRYVGAPHASYIASNKLCFEEYINKLRSYTFDQQHLKIKNYDGKSYEVYFIKAGSGSTQVPVPKDRAYTVSGNNVDGFIVTAELKG